MFRSGGHIQKERDACVGSITDEYEWENPEKILPHATLIISPVGPIGIITLLVHRAKLFFELCFSRRDFGLDKPDIFCPSGNNNEKKIFIHLMIMIMIHISVTRGSLLPGHVPLESP